MRWMLKTGCLRYVQKGRETMAQDLTRFLQAQEGSYAQALAEMKRGRKESHWIWYIFPQMKGLGRSAMSEFYGISGMEEARAYLKDPVLGARLAEICNALLALDVEDIVQVMGRPDDKKLKSSMTLFEAAAEDPEVFQRVLDKYYQGKRDGRTLRMLGME